MNEQKQADSIPVHRESTPRNATAEVRRIRSDDLLGSHGELIILHLGREYRLRLTQNGKLILTA